MTAYSAPILSCSMPVAAVRQLHLPHADFADMLMTCAQAGMSECCACHSGRWREQLQAEVASSAKESPCLKYTVQLNTMMNANCSKNTAQKEANQAVNLLVKLPCALEHKKFIVLRTVLGTMDTRLDGLPPA